MLSFKHAIIYQIFIDRFSGCRKEVKNTPDFLGGNLKSLTSKIEYLVDLGINTIWLTPFYETSQYHGYHITNFMAVDPHFGSIDDLKELIDKAHANSIKVIADFVPNHCSVDHPFFKDAIENKHSRYREWFYFKKWPQKYLCFLDVKVLPKLNLDFVDARNYMLGVANYWLSFGLDGYRVDHIIGPSHDFWRCFYSTIKRNYPDAIIFGEAWGKDIKGKRFNTVNFNRKIWRRIVGISQENLQLEYCKEFDGILDFELNKILLKNVRKGKDLLGNKKFLRKVNRHLNNYPKDFLLVTFLDNHDMDRFLRYCKGDTTALLQYISFLLSIDQPVVIYYGTENGVFNNVPVTDLNTDLFVREPFEWDHINMNLYNKLRDLFLARKEHSSK
jgi:glycosidase